jgi:hypothetical protein
MSLVSDYTFNNISRIGSDYTDYSQSNIQNTAYTNYMLSNYFPTNNTSYVQFAINQPTVNYSGVNGGSSVGAVNIDIDSHLMLKNEQERPLEKIQLSERPFLTVPYLGRGSCDPVVESKLLQGDVVSGKKSVSTISETTYIDYKNYPMMESIRETITNPNYLVQENAIDGWTRGGSSSRASK